MEPDPTHVYVHVPFCAHRCGYCDFVTVTGSEQLHERYVDALLRELAAWGAPDRADTVFVGGGTPSLLADPLLERLLAGLPVADELTVECNPETVTPAKAQVLVEGGVSRISLGAQSFRPHLLATLERLAAPDTVRAAVGTLRDAGVSSLNLDLIFGVPGESPADLDADVDDLLALGPDHISAYELEAKPGTRFTHAHGAELERQAGLIEGHYERVVERLTGAGYRWYETANFCRPGHEARHNLGYWTGHDYLGVGVGAVSTIGLERRRNRPSVPRYLAAVEAGQAPPAELEHLTPGERATERVMLGLRLDRPFAMDAADGVLDLEEADRLARAGLVALADGTIQLTDRGRFLTNSVLAAILR
jgi:oxygen-independent coproporphyrinogen-3 oxidase